MRLLRQGLQVWHRLAGRRSRSTFATSANLEQVATAGVPLARLAKVGHAGTKAAVIRIVTWEPQRNL